MTSMKQSTRRQVEAAVLVIKVPTDRANVGEQCRQLVEQDFDLRRMQKEYGEVYTQAGS